MNPEQALLPTLPGRQAQAWDSAASAVGGIRGSRSVIRSVPLGDPFAARVGVVLGRCGAQ